MNKNYTQTQVAPEFRSTPGKLTVHCLDLETNRPVADDFVVDCPAGQSFCVTNFPQVDDYSTETKEVAGFMPEDGSGRAQVVYYKRIKSSQRETYEEPVNHNDTDSGFFSRRTIAAIFSVLMIISASVHLARSLQALAYARAIREEAAKLQAAWSEIMNQRMPVENNVPIEDILDSAGAQLFGLPDSFGYKDPSQDSFYQGNASVGGGPSHAGMPSIGSRLTPQGRAPSSDSNIVP